MIAHNHQDHLDTTLTQYLAISLLSQYLKKPKMLNQTLFNCLSCLIMFGLNGVFMLCYFCVIVCAESYVLC
jgi:hypothetical protein